jgi:hypothetical protein
MPRVKRARDGSFRVELPPAERQLLVALVGQLRDLLGTDDPSLRRLTPPGHPDDEALEREYRELVGDELTHQRLRSLAVLEETADADRLDEEQVAAWLGAINDLRLVLGTRLDVTEDLYETGLPEEDPRAPGYAIYAYLGWLEEQVVRAMADGLPGGSSP